MIYEKKFWSEGNEFFDSNGNLYNGYVGISNGKAYKFPNGELLSNMHTSLPNFNTTSMFFDRILDDDLKLPYDKH